VTNLLDEKAGYELMFDDDNFPRSKLYFTLLQLCRMFQICVDKTLEGFKESRKGFFEVWDDRREETDIKDDLSILEEHWDKAMSNPMKKLVSISLRIKTKQEEVESLRDGVSLKYYS
jgi:hypothetical protein